jgi:cytochrome c oxidase subunit I+III
VTGLFVGSIFTPWAVVIGSVPVFITFVGWFWPDKKEDREELASESQPRRLALEEQE